MEQVIGGNGDGTQEFVDCVEMKRMNKILEAVSTTKNNAKVKRVYGPADKIKNVELQLMGAKSTLCDLLTKEMSASEDENFELAEKYRQEAEELMKRVEEIVSWNISLIVMIVFITSVTI